MIFFSVLNSSAASLKLAPIFGHGMVLQGNQEIPIWGNGTPNQRIKIFFRNQQRETSSDFEGNWKIILDVESYGGPDKLTVATISDTLILSDVYVGEVWICSGQSNMEMPMVSDWAHVDNAEAEVAKANYPNIHLFKVGRNIAYEPVSYIKTGGWMTCTPKNIKDFSAVGYFFGRELYENLKVPVGLLETAWGGTMAEAWTSGKALNLMDDFKGRIKKIENCPKDSAALQKNFETDYQKFLEDISKKDKGFKGDEAIFTSVDLDDSDWLPMNLPGMWESSPLGGLDGAVWFRKTVFIPATDKGKAMQLSFGAPDDADETWFNGVKIGSNTEWDVTRQYEVSPELIRAGKNVITIRITDHRGDGGFMGDKSEFFLTDKKDFNINLSEDWKCKVGYNLNDIKTYPVKPGDPNQPSVLFNGMINPLIPYAFSGVIWYQGESNTGRAEQYERLFPAMITSWRDAWGRKDFPFLYVQLTSYHAKQIQPVTNDSWAELRDAQTKALKLPNTAMAVTIDLGDADQLHPGNKQDVGKRLSLLARHQVYGEGVPCYSPQYESVRTNKNIVEIEFRNVYDGLRSSDNLPLTGFAVAGADGIFYWAKAKIEGNKIIVSSKQVTNPEAISYAWASNPAGNLINSEELPACPFKVTF